MGKYIVYKGIKRMCLKSDFCAEGVRLAPRWGSP